MVEPRNSIWQPHFAGKTLQKESTAVGVAGQATHGLATSTWYHLLNHQLRAGGGSFGATKAELESAQEGSRGAVGTDGWETVAVLFAE